MWTNIPFKYNKLACICTFILALLLAAGKVGSAQETGRGLEIAREADRRDAGFGDTRAKLTMLITTPRGDHIVREMRQMTLETADDGEKTIMAIDRPRDLKGTAILTFTHKVVPDDQWLYLPVIKRVKRISSADKSGPFMGSEFAYEDLASQEVEKYRYRYLRDELLDEVMCFVVERVPVDESSGYTRQVAWIDQNEYRLRQVEYYDRKGELLKTMELQNYQQYLDQYWRPGRLVMINRQNGNSTALEFSDYQFRTGLTEGDFTRGALSRIR
jgi:outer membrane lipoprotein-sorting protein